MEKSVTVVSIVIPIHNGSQWIDECFTAIQQQELIPSVLIELSVHNDCSTDDTCSKLELWKTKFSSMQQMSLVIGLSHGTSGNPAGVGAAKNTAVKNSKGDFLCFQDVDDVMHPQRLRLQLEAAMKRPNAIIGSKFVRDPADSTLRYSHWANNLPQHLLNVQVYTSHGPTVIMPTWFCSRAVFDRVGGFSEAGRGTPEDLLFFYRHLDLGGTVFRVEETLLTYRHHPQATTLSIAEQTIWDMRLKRLEEKIVKQWDSFAIWNAGKQGRRLWRSLSDDARTKVRCFCDVDVKKIGRAYEPYLGRKSGSVKIPIVDYKTALPPFVICVKMDLTGGEFERNLASLNLTEDVDYVMFS